MRSQSIFGSGFGTGVRLLGFVLMLLLPQASVALGSGMYQAAIPVDSQSREDRDKGMKLGLEQVLVRLSGQSDARREPSVREAIRVAPRYVQSFTYQQGLSDGVMLQLQYDPELVQSLLRRAELPMWVSGRPTVLLWLAIDDGGSKTLVGPRTTAALSKRVETEMARRGIPIKWPSSSGIKLDEVRRLQTDRIREASSRYAEQAIFAGSFVVAAGSDSPELAQWNGRCLYLSQSDEQDLGCLSGTQAQFLAQAVDSLADVIADRFSVQISGGESSSLRLEVNEVDSFEGYGRALQHLQSNALVRNTRVIQVSQGRVLFELDLQGTEQQFQDSLSSQRILQSVDAGGGGALRYRLSQGSR